jgi:hypothetical protein
VARFSFHIFLESLSASVRAHKPKALKRQRTQHVQCAPQLSACISARAVGNFQCAGGGFINNAAPINELSQIRDTPFVCTLFPHEMHCNPFYWIGGPLICCRVNHPAVLLSAGERSRSRCLQQMRLILMPLRAAVAALNILCYVHSCCDKQLG